MLESNPYINYKKKLLIDITGMNDKNLNDVDEGINVIKRKLRKKKGSYCC